MNLIFTVAWASEVPFVQTLENSIREHWPEAKFKVILADKCPFALPENFVLADDDRFDVGVLCQKYDSKELKAALKIKGFQYFKNQGFEWVYFVNPRAFITSPWQFPSERQIHLVAQSTQAEAFPDEKQILNAGMFTGEVIGVNQAPEFLAWWAGKDVFFAPEKGIFYDSLWLNHVPIFFDHVFIDKTGQLTDGLWGQRNPSAHLKHAESASNQAFGIHKSDWFRTKPSLGLSYQEVHPLKKSLAGLMLKMGQGIDGLIKKVADFVY